MPAITGLTESTKYAILDYCNRHNITQVAWVEKHINTDLEKEKESPKEKRGDSK
jgi:hypothetical protein